MARCVTWRYAAIRSLSGVQRTSPRHRKLVVPDPKRTFILRRGKSVCGKANFTRNCRYVRIRHKRDRTVP
jgi:hypothetical protein